MFSQNSFVEKLGPFGFDTFRMLVVDFMHECELGTWKAVFIHLIRLCHIPFLKPYSSGPVNPGPA
jgi:hypothetical protein